MSDIAKNIYEDQKNDFLENESSIEVLGEMYGLEGPFSAYVLILDGSHSEYDNRLTKLEVNFYMFSAGYCYTKAGFNKESGESGRIGMFGSDAEMSSEKISEILGDVLFDIYKIK